MALLLFFVAAGCFNNQLIKGYGFSARELVVDQKDMVISAQLIGSFSPGEAEGGYDVLIRRSPYTLSFLVNSGTGYYREVRVSNVVLTNPKNQNLLSRQLASAGSKFSEVPTGYMATASFPDLELPHEPIQLTATVEIFTQANSVIKQTVSFSFAPSYSEEKTKKEGGAEKKGR